MKAVAAALAAIAAVQICFVSFIVIRRCVGGASSSHRPPGVPVVQHAHSREQQSFKSCLFIISTAKNTTQHILSQFASYDDDASVGLWLNVYNDNEEQFAITDGIVTTRTLGGKSIISSSIPGLKPTLWERATSQYTSSYEYLYFLDDDMLFDKSVFAFDQFRWLVEHTDAVMATPKIIRMEANAGEEPPAGGIKGQVRSLLKPSKNENIDKQRQQQYWSRSAPLGLYKGESTADRIAAKVKVVEIGSFLIKQAAWNFFLSEIFVPSTESDCGPDCVFCRVFEQADTRHFGKVPCVRSLHVGIIHTDTRTYTSALSQRENETNGTKCCGCTAQINAYFEKLRQRYGIDGQKKKQCKDKSMEYMSLDALRSEA